MNGTVAHNTHDADSPYGVHDWIDKRGNRGTRVLSRRHVTVQTFRTSSLFEPGYSKTVSSLTDYLNSEDLSIRRLFVVVDGHLPESSRDNIATYFEWCKIEKLLQDYTIFAFAVDQSEKTLQGGVATVIAGAKQFGLKRRDLFVAVGSRTATDVVGFAAATYRRSTPWILVPTDLFGMIQSSACGNRLSLNHKSLDGTNHRTAFALSHPPVASFHDLRFVSSMQREEVRLGMVEMINIAIHNDSGLFSYIEAHSEGILERNQEATYLKTATGLASSAAATARCKSWYEDAVPFQDGLARAIAEIESVDGNEAESAATVVALISVLSCSKGFLNSADLGRILTLLSKTGLLVLEEALDANQVWRHLRGAFHEGTLGLILPDSIGRGKYLEVSELTVEDIAGALSILHQHYSNVTSKLLESGSFDPYVDVGRNEANVIEDSFEQSASEDMEYHVATIPRIFAASNATLIEDYCVDNSYKHKKKILVLVDDNLSGHVNDIKDYFKGHEDAIGDYLIFPMQVSSKGKDVDSTLNVVDAAIALKMSRHDIMLVVGGGTLMDIVGFAASIFKGGIPYVRIPTTLLGMIDAGVGVKVGVNFKNHKSLVGRYYAPVACLNDPETFLDALSQRDFTCGVAEAIKMALVRSPRLFEVIEKHHRDIRDNKYTHELIHISIRTMLEELQPNLLEHDLRRLVDFGHEFGHIVESLAEHEIPHGECVAIGMSISSFLAHLNGILSQPELERILNCILDSGLPIYTAEHDCCNADVLWRKISTEGTEHKDGMLWLAIPEAIGQGSFLDHISDIDPEMVSKALASLKSHAERHARESTSGANGYTEINPSGLDIGASLANKPSSCNGTQPHPSTAAIIGASGDIGSQLACYLLDQGVRVICSVRPASLHSFKRRVDCTGSNMRIVVGDALDLENLRAMIREADVVYNMAGAVTLSSKPGDFPKVLALNGFAQGIVKDLILQMGRGQDVKVVYPSTQRVHLTIAHASVSMWVLKAAQAYSFYQAALFAAADVHTELERFAERFISQHPLPADFNVYEVSKQLGEYFVSLLPRHLSMRISGVYGPSFRRGFVCRALNPKAGENAEASEIRDFIYVDDLNELLLKAAQAQPADTDVFDGVSGESLHLEEVWRMARKLIGDHDRVTATFDDSKARENFKLDPTYARNLLGRDFTPMRLGLRSTVEGRLSRLEQEPIQEQAPIEGPKSPLGHWNKPPVIVLDVGATYLRIGVADANGLRGQPVRVPSPTKQSFPEDTLEMLQERLIETLVYGIGSVRVSYGNRSITEIGISFGAVITREGVIVDASVLWGVPARGFDLKRALTKRLPGLQFTILNDISAAAWRYKDEGRFCLITVSSGLSNKVFNPDLCDLSRLDLDAAGVGGEMGHVVVEPRAVDALVRSTILEAAAQPADFRGSRLSAYVNGDAQNITARHLAMAAREGDELALRLLEKSDVPSCACGNLADLCSYSSGRGALRRAQILAAREDHGIASQEVTDKWLQQAITAGHPLALKVLRDATYPLALRVLQLAADIGLDKFILVGGFITKMGQKAYLQALQHHLVRFYYNSAFFGDWTEDKIRGLVRLGVHDDNDGLIGLSNFVQHLRAHHQAVEKSVGEQSLTVVTRAIPRCGSREVLAKVVFSGVCTTDLQILRGERGLEPTVLGHEGVLQVLEAGKDVRGLSVGEIVILNPNNPLDDHDKLGHTKEGVFQEYVKFGQESLDRKQVLSLGHSVASATDTLVEPLSCVVAAQERIKDRIAGRNVIVVGAGLMGLMFVTMNFKMGARNVFLANRSKERLDFAVARGIVPENKAFVLGDCVSSQVEEISSGKGVDIVIICVSLGQGVQATQDAMRYVNPGGCIYLFAGFRPGDTLALSEGRKIDAWSIRTGWKTERVEADGKSLDLSGHRGSRNEDLATAADVIRGDDLSFGRMVSHIISLDVLPDVMLALARDGRIEGVPAKRAVVDMAARGPVIESAEEYPLRHLYEATRRSKDAVSMGNIFREIGFEGDTPMLGWVCPPEWQEIKVTVDAALKKKPLTSKRHFIWVGTGNWIFLVDALKELMPASQDVVFHTVQSLDPQALKDLFMQVIDLSAAVCLGISQSGRTMETILLMNALRERFDSAGLDYREHFVWLTDTNQAGRNGDSGEVVIRSLDKHDWKDVEVLPLTVSNHSDINALHAMPHSMPMFLALVLLLRKDYEALRFMYQQYLALRPAAVHGTLVKAYSVASNHVEHLQLVVDGDIVSAVSRSVTQLIEQGLGAKEAGFNPRVRVTSLGKVAGFQPVALTVPTEAPAAVKAMLTMNALSIFVAVVAYHRRIEFVTHHSVDLYKRRSVELIATDEPQQDLADSARFASMLVEYLSSNHHIRFVEVVYYGHISTAYRQSVKDWLASSPDSNVQRVSINVIAGEEWNHSRYQAAVKREDAVFMILVPQEYCSQVDGISHKATEANIKTLQAIARATYETLLPHAMYCRVSEGFPKEEIPVSGH
ncbi:MAG: hypothetical protein MMC23_003231 [Stictis urceolatum]|nr:hypothetical protein [Stictis urceolata]